MKPKKGRMPKSVPYIIGSEIAERFSFYGLRSIMVTLYGRDFFQSNPESRRLLPKPMQRPMKCRIMFVTLAYFMPLVGAILADWFFGKYQGYFICIHSLYHWSPHSLVF